MEPAFGCLVVALMCLGSGVYAGWVALRRTGSPGLLLLAALSGLCAVGNGALFIASLIR